MLITKEVVMSLIIALGIGKYSEMKSPKYFDMITDHGSTFSIQIDTSNKNPCPRFCGADHYHRVLISENESMVDEFYTLIGYKSDDIYLNSYSVVDYQEIEFETKGKKNDLRNVNVQTYLP